MKHNSLDIVFCFRLPEPIRVTEKQRYEGERDSSLLSEDWDEKNKSSKDLKREEQSERKDLHWR